MSSLEEGLTKLQNVTKENTDFFCQQHMNGIQFLMKLSSPILIFTLYEECMGTDETPVLHRDSSRSFYNRSLSTHRLYLLNL